MFNSTLKSLIRNPSLDFKSSYGSQAALWSFYECVCFVRASGDPAEVSECGGPAAGSFVQQSSIENHLERVAGHPEAVRGGAREAVTAKVLPQREICLDR